MATSETLRPTVATQIDATLVNGANGYDGNTGTYAELVEATEGARAVANFDGFPAGAIAANKRQSVILEVYASWGTADGNDKAALYARAKSGDPWTLVTFEQPSAGWGSGTLRQFDITDLVGTEPLTSFDLQVVFENLGTGAGGDPPVWSDF